MNLDQHPILMEMYQLHRKIDSLEASEANTECCIMAGKLGDNLRVVLAELISLRAQVNSNKPSEAAK
jgi:hypothetical protein